MSRTIKKTQKKSQKKTQKKTQKQLQKQLHKQFTARIIIKDNVGGIVADKDSIKELLESMGSKVEVIIYNDIKTNINIKNKTKSNIKFGNVDIQIFIEHIFLEHPLEIFPADKSYIFVNQEYIQDWDIANMQSGNILPLCKTHESLKTLHKLGIMSAKYVGFGNNKKNEYTDTDTITKLQNLFIHIVGASPMKGTTTLIDTWIQKKIRHPLVITANNKSGGNTNLFKYWQSLKPKVALLPESLLNKWEEWKNITNSNKSSLPQFETIESCAIYFCNTVLEYTVIQFLQSVADVHMCPSLIEGWGQYIDEGRRAKAVVLTLDAPPVNELIKDSGSDSNTNIGILVKASKGPKMKQLLPYGWTQYFTKNKEYNKFLYGTFKTSVNDLYTGISRILKMTTEQKKQLGINALKQSQQDYTIFKKLFTKVILDSQ